MREDAMNELMTVEMYRMIEEEEEEEEGTHDTRV